MPSQWVTSLQNNTVPYWLCANIESAMYYINIYIIYNSAYPWSRGVANCLTEHIAEAISLAIAGIYSLFTVTICIALNHK